MICRDSFKPAVSGLDQFNQQAELSRLSEYAERVSRQPSSYLVYRGISKLIELDLLRYGYLPTAGRIKRGFGVVRQSDAIRSFISREILPHDLTSAVVLILLAEGCEAVETEDSLGKPDFVFCLAGDYMPVVERIVEEYTRPSQQDTPELGEPTLQ